jgi:hypothetical protein
MAKPKIEIPETKEICDKNIRDGKFEHEQFELPNINSKDVKNLSDSLVKK